MSACVKGIEYVSMFLGPFSFPLSIALTPAWVKMTGKCTAFHLF